MLETLKIKNLATIDQAEIPFQSGLNILSGETGAGKSIVIEAISLILGSRANTDLIRSGETELQIEGIFGLKEIPWLKSRLEEAGFESEGQELLIRRIVSNTGKHRIHINGQLATLSLLQTLTEGLIDLCGQNEHQSLMKPSVQINLIDRYGSLEAMFEKYSLAFKEYQTLIRQKRELETAEAERARRLDFIAFQLEEINAAGIQRDEDVLLLNEKKLLQSAEARSTGIDAILELLEGDNADQAGAIAQIQTAATKAKTMASLDAPLAQSTEALERALIELEEVGLSLSRYRHSIEADPSRLQWVTDRIGDLSDLKKKYGGSLESILEYQERLAAEQKALMEIKERREELDAKIISASATLKNAGMALSKRRKSAAEQFGSAVTQELNELKMEDAVFSVHVDHFENIEDWTHQGPDTVTFWVQTNRGEEAKAIGKIASGGELSRIMLGARRVISDRGGIGVYLFDEIDAGIGGQTAFEVGRKLKSVAQFNQVICITHVPQVASFADHHLNVQKRTEGKRTFTAVHELSNKERREEVARMLGGPKLTPKSLENADELMGMAATMPKKKATTKSQRLSSIER